MIRTSITLLLVTYAFGLCAQDFNTDPGKAEFHTEDISLFWSVYDLVQPKPDGAAFQKIYLEAGSAGLKAFVPDRIESGKHLSKVIKDNLDYYKSIRESSLSIANKKERFYECFSSLKVIYPEAVFPDVYFVIGAKNSGGTTFDGGLIIGAEMFGETNATIQAPLDIDLVDEVVAHELIHFQQKYVKDNSLLAQSIREGSADFIAELIAGNHSNKKIYVYGDAHEKELWTEFSKRMFDNDWNGWLYYQKDKSRPKDLGYWMGYKITKAYYDRAEDKSRAVHEILNIQDFKTFLEKSGYQ
jgi:hypothetical protein